MLIKLEEWVGSILADPLTKAAVKSDFFQSDNSILDARIFLKNTHGYQEWAEGQHEYEDLIAKEGESASPDKYREEIERDRPVYSHFQL